MVETINTMLAEIQAKGGAMVLNVADNKSIDALVEQLKTHYRLPDILVNNAGITRDNIMLRMKDEEWDDIINTNLTSIYRMTKVCLKSMVKNRWGRIINISSVVGCAGSPGQSNYAAAKAGATHIGLNLYEKSPRYVPMEKAAALRMRESKKRRQLACCQSKTPSSASPLYRFGSLTH